MRGITIGFLIAGCLMPVVLRGQTDAKFNQYWAMPSLYNAAAVGRDAHLNLAAGARLQWVGTDDAPRDILATVDMPVMFAKRNHGFGVVAMSETAGLYATTFAALQYAFKIRIGKGVLHIGVQPGAAVVGYKGSKANSNSDGEAGSSDPAIPATDLSSGGFDLGAGVYYALRQWYAGVSVTHLTEPQIRLSDSIYSTPARNLYFMAGGNIAAGNSLFEISPSLLVRSDLQTFQAEAALRATFKQKFWVGAGYRYNDGAIAMLGLHLKAFSVGYAYDYSLSPHVEGSSGSHEMFMRYTIQLSHTRKQNYRYKSIRIL